MADMQGFNASEVEPGQSFDALPVGWYEAIIIESERKQNSAGTGSYLKLTFQLTQSPYQGRKQWANLNLDNPNAQAVQIARGHLSAICRAVGVITPKDSTELHNIPLLIKLGQKTYEGELQNEVKGFKAREAAAPVQATGPGTQKPVAPVSAGSAPWKK